MSYSSLNPNGVAAATDASPMTLAAYNFVDSTRVVTSLPLNYEFLTGTTGATSTSWYDALGYSWFSMSITIVNTISAGTINIESTNDNVNANLTIPMPVQQVGQASANRLTTVSVTGVNTTRHYEGPITARYVRIRLSASMSGSANIKVTAGLTQYAPSLTTQSAYLIGSLPAGANSIGTARLIANTSTLGTLGLGSTQSVDVASGTFTTSASSGSAVLSMGSPSSSFALTVTAVSGTSPTMDMVIQESHDNATFVDVYHFERVTAAGTYVTPVLRFNGAYIRFTRTLGGTTPSFTYSLTRSTKPTSGSSIRSYFDRTIIPNTLSSTSPAFFIQGCNQVSMVASVISAGSAATFALQVAYEPTTWFTVGTTTPASGTVTAIANVATLAKWARATVTTAGTSEVLNYLQITATGP